ncbi:hypothetical protein BVC80_9059g5 [Macleaya cordata]|uniref:Uncharacterized protein n=1 Tax=Macleaya cordata TaxID=56857 RepID=A0A200RAF1_MACCD|nr:hypothetical protein BVC80_9059g5 [Macleaya cordata]
MGKSLKLAAASATAKNDEIELFECEEQKNLTPSGELDQIWQKLIRDADSRNTGVLKTVREEELLLLSALRVESLKMSCAAWPEHLPT